MAAEGKIVGRSLLVGYFLDFQDYFINMGQNLNEAPPGSR